MYLLRCVLYLPSPSDTPAGTIDLKVVKDITPYEKGGKGCMSWWWPYCSSATACASLSNHESRYHAYSLVCLNC